jgi:hypothetical protein
MVSVFEFNEDDGKNEKGVKAIRANNGRYAEVRLAAEGTKETEHHELE